MGPACIAQISNPDSKEQFRQMIHDAVDDWVDELLCVFDEDRQATLMEMSELFTRTKQKFLGDCLQRMIVEKYADLLEQEYASCPKCAKRCKKRFDSPKEMVTMQGAVAVIRP